MLFLLKWIDHSLQSNGKELKKILVLQKSHFGHKHHFQGWILSTKHVDN